MIQIYFVLRHTFQALPSRTSRALHRPGRRQIRAGQLVSICSLKKHIQLYDKAVEHAHTFFSQVRSLISALQDRHRQSARDLDTDGLYHPPGHADLIHPKPVQRFRKIRRAVVAVAVPHVLHLHPDFPHLELAEPPRPCLRQPIEHISDGNAEGICDGVRFPEEADVGDDERRERGPSGELARGCEVADLPFDRFGSAISAPEEVSGELADGTARDFLEDLDRRWNKRRWTSRGGFPVVLVAHRFDDEGRDFDPRERVARDEGGVDQDDGPGGELLDGWRAANEELGARKLVLDHDECIRGAQTPP